jgi:hypothetical protein
MCSLLRQRQFEFDTPSHAKGSSSSIGIRVDSCEGLIFLFNIQAAITTLTWGLAKPAFRTRKYCFIITMGFGLKAEGPVPKAQKAKSAKSQPLPLASVTHNRSAFEQATALSP